MSRLFARICSTLCLLSVPLLANSQAVPTNAPPTFGPVSNWGCEVLLCLADPSGPMNKAECRPPITRLYRAIFRWRPQPFPVCIMANGSNSRGTGNYAQVGPPSYYDACPAGTSALPAGALAVVTPNASSATTQPIVVGGIGDGYNIAPDPDSGNAMPQKVCVGASTGQTTVSIGQGMDATTVNADTYSNVVLIDPAPNTFTIQVYINNQLYKNVRPGTVQ